MPEIKTLLWYFLGVLALAVTYLKRRLIFEIIKEKLEFQKQYSDIKKEAYQVERLKQAKVQGVLKARQPGLLSGVGTNIKKLSTQDIKIPKKKSKKKKEEPKSNMEKLMGL